MLGAWSLGIDYTGIDLNSNMKPAYDEMIDFLHNFNEIDNPLFEVKSTSNLEMIWDSALNVDFSQIDYDFVLTSPPYINMELYEGMPKWESDEAFYTGFYIPLYHKLRANIKPGGKICLNVSPKMHEDAIKYGLPLCDVEEDLLQQMGQAKGKKKQDKIYIWHC
jgi:DNA modification methylase